MSQPALNFPNIDIRRETGHGLPNDARIEIRTCIVTQLTGATLQTLINGNWHDTEIFGTGHGRADALADLHQRLDQLSIAACNIQRAIRRATS